jgi:hypothetical protein
MAMMDIIHYAKYGNGKFLFTMLCLDVAIWAVIYVSILWFGWLVVWLTDLIHRRYDDRN